jgi:hypothetical protein
MAQAPAMQSPQAAHNPCIAADMLEAGYARIVSADNATEPKTVALGAHDATGRADALSQQVVYHSTGMQTEPLCDGYQFREIYGRDTTPDDFRERIGTAALGYYNGEATNRYALSYGAAFVAAQPTSKPPYVDSDFQTADYDHCQRALVRAKIKASMLAKKYSRAAEEAGVKVWAESKDEKIVHSEQLAVKVELDADGNVKDGDLGGLLLPNIYGEEIKKAGHNRPEEQSRSQHTRPNIPGVQAYTVTSQGITPPASPVLAAQYTTVYGTVYGTTALRPIMALEPSTRGLDADPDSIEDYGQELVESDADEEMEALSSMDYEQTDYIDPWQHYFAYATNGYEHLLLGSIEGAMGLAVDENIENHGIASSQTNTQTHTYEEHISEQSNTETFSAQEGHVRRSSPTNTPSTAERAAYHRQRTSLEYEETEAQRSSKRTTGSFDTRGRSRSDRSRSPSRHYRSRSRSRNRRRDEHSRHRERRRRSSDRSREDERRDRKARARIHPKDNEGRKAASSRERRLVPELESGHREEKSARAEAHPRAQRMGDDGGVDAMRLTREIEDRRRQQRHDDVASASRVKWQHQHQISSTNSDRKANADDTSAKDDMLRTRRAEELRRERHHDTVMIGQSQQHAPTNPQNGVSRSVTQPGHNTGKPESGDSPAVTGARPRRDPKKGFEPWTGSRMKARREGMADGGGGKK